MKVFHFEGHSDDTFGEYNVKYDDYDNCASGEPIYFTLSHGDDGVLVSGQYCPGSASGWVIGVGSYLDADGDTKPLPSWPMRFEHSKLGYSPRLVVEAPDETVLTCLMREE